MRVTFPPHVAARSLLAAAGLTCCASVAGCASSASPAAPVVAGASAGAAPASARLAAAVTPPSPAEDEADDESDPATMKPVLGKGALPVAKRTVTEGECWHTVALSGDARRDYASLVEHCGKPTGAVEYAKPAIGKLDYLRDQRDTFIIFLRGGLCYRFFGVGDATIPNLDILIERNGALQGEDRTHGPVAIINSDQAWCMDSDAEYRFHVQIRGEGGGRYVFGVWARPGT